jgi:hypothetical protein
MKKLTKYFFALIALFLICYLSTAFINANVDFTKWDLHLCRIFSWVYIHRNHKYNFG